MKAGLSKVLLVLAKLQQALTYCSIWTTSFVYVCVCVLVDYLVCVLQASIDIPHTSLYGQCVYFHPSASWNHSVIYIKLQPRNTPAFVEIHGM